MIYDNIKKYRKEKGLSQEEMAVKLHVVRQTVSKWENGLSVPDAEVLIDMATLLEIPVSKLLGTEAESTNTEELTNELVRLNEQLAIQSRRELLVSRANKKRGLILLLSFLAMLVSLRFESEVVSVTLSGTCILAAVAVLYRNLALLTSITTEDMKLKVLRITTMVNVTVMVTAIVLATLTAAGIVTFSEHGEKVFAMLLIAGVMIFAGIISPKLPFTRHTGLRLPWTVQDQDTWNIAHMIIGYISLPLALLFVACGLTIENFEMVTLITMFLWIGIPGGLSFLYYWKKVHGKLV